MAETWQEVLKKNSIASLEALAQKFGPENFPELDRLRQAAENFEFRISPAMVELIKSPNDPIWRKDPAVALYKSILERFAPSAKWTDVYNWYGMTVAWTMVDTLKRAGKNLTRAGLLRAARSLDTTANPFLLPGTRLRTSAKDAFPLDTVYLYRYDNRQWVRTAGPFPAR